MTLVVDSALHGQRRMRLGSAAIIGVGQSAYARRPEPGQSTHTFIRDAAVAALAEGDPPEDPADDAVWVSTIQALAEQAIAFALASDGE